MDLNSILKSLNGNNTPDETVRLVWNKAQIVPGFDPSIQRKDRCGAWIKLADYGNTNSQFCWEIDHIKPKSMGGSDDLSNLQPLQWRNNRAKSDNPSVGYCVVSARQ